MNAFQTKNNFFYLLIINYCFEELFGKDLYPKIVYFKCQCDDEVHGDTDFCWKSGVLEFSIHESEIVSTLF